MFFGCIPCGQPSSERLCFPPEPDLPLIVQLTLLMHLLLLPGSPRWSAVVGLRPYYTALLGIRAARHLTALERRFRDAFEAVTYEGAEPTELRAAFLESVRHGLAALEASQGDTAWREAAFRLRGLAASFGAVRLMAIATEAAEAEAQDAALLRRLRRAAERL